MVLTQQETQSVLKVGAKYTLQSCAMCGASKTVQPTYDLICFII